MMQNIIVNHSSRVKLHGIVALGVALLATRMVASGSGSPELLRQVGPGRAIVIDEGSLGLENAYYKSKMLSLEQSQTLGSTIIEEIRHSTQAANSSVLNHNYNHADGLRAQHREGRKFNLFRGLWNKPNISPLYLINGTVCRFVNTTPICTTLQTNGLLPASGSTPRSAPATASSVVFANPKRTAASFEDETQPINVEESGANSQSGAARQGAQAFATYLGSQVALNRRPSGGILGLLRPN